MDGTQFFYYDGLQPKMSAGMIKEHECKPILKWKLCSMKMKFKITWREKQDMNKKKIKASFFFDKLNQEVRWLCKGRRGRVIILSSFLA